MPAPDQAPLRVGFAGCGFATRTRHLPSLRRLREIEVVALADPDPAALAETGDRFRVRGRYADVAGLVADPAVEAVAVCVPVGGHSEVALAALAARKHLLLEKPITLDLEEADRLLARAAGSDVTVMVGFNLRWHRHVLSARRLVASGTLGRIQSLATVFSDPLLSRAGVPAWRSRRTAGGGALFDKLAHHFDLWRFLLGDEVDEVSAMSCTGKGDDSTVGVTGRTRDGVLVTALGMDDSFLRHEITIYGERGGVHVDCYRFDGLRRYAAEDLPGSPRTRLRHLAATVADARANVAAIRRGGDFDASYDGEWRHFAASVRHGRAPSCGLEDGRAALEIALAADRSRATGASVRLGSRP